MTTLAPRVLPLGPVMLDLQGCELSPEERERLLHPNIGGVILFSRNFSTLEALTELCTQIHSLRSPPLLIAVDHEGGRVQRFREGFTPIAPMRQLGRCWEDHPERALRLATDCGFVLASELRAHGVDFSFAPVLDIDFSHSQVIGDRAFHSDPLIIARLATAFIQGLRLAGMASVGKHFPGHGFVKADSHIEIPIDNRAFEQIDQIDLIPFRQLVHAGLDAVMPAHVIYPAVDSQPAGFSHHWLQTILRGSLHFDGVIFSDDLSMEGAKGSGSITDRALLALKAGCDMILVCNDPKAAFELMGTLDYPYPQRSRDRLMRMRPVNVALNRQALAVNVEYQRALSNLHAM